MANQGSLSPQKQDMVNILKFSSQYEIGNPTNAKKILQFVNSKGMMTSSIGKAYTTRLAEISNGATPDKCSCLFCKKKNISRWHNMRRLWGKVFRWQITDQEAIGKRNCRRDKNKSYVRSDGCFRGYKKNRWHSTEICKQSRSACRRWRKSRA